MFDRRDDNHAAETDSASFARSLFRLVRQTTWDVVTTIVPAVVIALLVTHFVGQRTSVLGQSMEPNLHTGQNLIVDKLSYRFHSPRRGDIAVLDVGSSDVNLIKRVIGLPGETIAIRDNHVFIDGQLLEEPYLSDVRQQDYGPFLIPHEQVFVLGDNRGSSNDSRYIGPIHFSRIIGRAWVTLWPLEEIGRID